MRGHFSGKKEMHTSTNERTWCCCEITSGGVLRGIGVGKGPGICTGQDRWCQGASPAKFSEGKVIGKGLGPWEAARRCGQARVKGGTFLVEDLEVVFLQQWEALGGSRAELQSDLNRSVSPHSGCEQSWQRTWGGSDRNIPGRMPVVGCRRSWRRWK